MKAGAVVKVKGTLLEGVVKQRRLTPDDDFQYLVGFTDLEGAEQERWFEESMIQETGGQAETSAQPPSQGKVTEVKK